MNFKRNFTLISALVGTTFLVAGCSKDKTFARYEFINEVQDLHEDEVFDDGAFNKLGNYKSYKACIGGNEFRELGDAYSVMENTSAGVPNGGKSLMYSTGDQSIIVVPVEFQDFTCSQLGISESRYITDLNKAFFGVAKNNTYVSVSQYYNYSSYGKLRISGKVCDKFYTFKKTVSQINQGLDRSLVASYYSDVIAWYKENYDDIDKYRIDDTKPAEANNVAIYMVYTYPTEMGQKNEKFFWAFTFPDVPLSWSSYSFLYNQTDKPDAHTFIHESGHLFGLNDYYPTTSDTSTFSVYEPTARIDMMDCSIGDHTAYSKMYLNWARPYHVIDDCEITLKPLVESGDIILINNDWNGTVFDEFYLVEFYSPTGLNYHDSNIGNSSAKLPTLPGIKVYHVDARLAYFDETLKTFRHYATENGTDINNCYISFAHDNNTYPNASTQTEAYKSNYLYQLMLNNTINNTLQNNYDYVQNLHLYREGDEISELKFNQQNRTKFTIAVTSVNYREATIKFEKKAQN